MKASLKAFATAFLLILVLLVPSYAQNNDKDRGKSFYTSEEVKQMCGVPVDPAEMKKVLAKQDSMYEEYVQKTKRSESGLFKVETIPNWQGMMSDVEWQGLHCGSCWVHAATGIVEGQLSILYGSRLNADLDELEIPGACNGGFPTQAENFIRTSKMRSEVASYPNLQGVRWGIISYSTTSGITAIKNSLANGPVAACFYVYDDFSTFFYYYPTGVYHYDGYSPFDGGHAVVIVSYDDNGQFWLCKNSWGSNWADNGYFRIGYGQCGIESWENSVVTVNQSCYAKIVPNLFSTINTAFTYPFVNAEWADVIGSTTLSGNISIASGQVLTLLSSANINFNGYYIESTGGAFNLNGLVAFVSGTKYYALFPTIQSAINSAPSGQTVQLPPWSYTESPSFSSKSNITLTGQGQGSTTLNGGISVTNSSYITISNLTMSNALGLNNNTWTNFWNATIMGCTLAIDYGGTMNEIGYVTANNIGASFGLTAYGGTGDLFYSSVSNGDCAVYLSNNASYNIGTNNTFCSNGYDIDAENGAYAYAISNDYSRPLPSTIRGNVFVTGQNGVCGQPKALVTRNKTIQQTPSELRALDEQYLGLLRKIRDDKAANRYDAKNYVQDYQQLLDGYKGLIKDGSDKSVIKAALSKVTHLYKGVGDISGFKAYITETLASGKLKSVEPYLKRYFIWDYVNSKQYDNSLKIADEVLSSADAAEDLLAEMLYEKGLIYKYYLNDTDKANEMYALLMSKYPSSPLVAFAKVEVSSNPGYASKNVAAETNQPVKTATSELYNYPNPFNPTTVISYQLSTTGRASLKVYDVLGREVATLVDEQKPAGSYSVIFDGSHLPSGVYFYRLQVGGLNKTLKMILAK